jgi:hypothetical protein
MVRWLGLIIVALGMGAAACGGDGGNDGLEATRTHVPATSRTATEAGTPETATPGPSGSEEPGADGFRAFAAEIQGALDRRDAGFFIERIKPETGTCTAGDLTPGIGQLPCETEGQQWEGFPLGRWRSEGGYVDPAEAPTPIDLHDEALPDDSDAFGDGTVRIHAIATDGMVAHSIVTALVQRPPDFAGEGPLRQVRVQRWTFDSERWRYTGALTANVLAEEFLVPCQEALNYLDAYGAAAWERFPDPAAAGPGQELCL